MTITASDAQPGDVLLDSAGTTWQRGDDVYTWATFAGPVGYYGPWQESYGPQGELELLARAGRAVRQLGLTGLPPE